MLTVTKQQFNYLNFGVTGKSTKPGKIQGSSQDSAYKSELCGAVMKRCMLYGIICMQYSNIRARKLSFHIIGPLKHFIGGLIHDQNKAQYYTVSVNFDLNPKHACNN